MSEWRVETVELIDGDFVFNLDAVFKEKDDALWYIKMKHLTPNEKTRRLIEVGDPPAAEEKKDEQLVMLQSMAEVVKAYDALCTAKGSIEPCGMWFELWREGSATRHKLTIKEDRTKQMPSTDMPVEQVAFNSTLADLIEEYGHLNEATGEVTPVDAVFSLNIFEGNKLFNLSIREVGREQIN